MPANTVTARLAIEFEAKGDDEPFEISEPNIAAAANDVLPGLGGPHLTA
jgi:hypothetical protein